MDVHEAQCKARGLYTRELVEQLQRNAQELMKRSRTFQTWLKHQTKGKSLDTVHPWRRGKDRVFEHKLYEQVTDLLGSMEWLLQEHKWPMKTKQLDKEQVARRSPTRKARSPKPRRTGLDT